MNKAFVFALFVISLAAGFTLWGFSKSMTPYVTIKQARDINSMVQVRGKILHETSRYDSEGKALRFEIEDENKERIEVVYQGAKPEAFDTAPETAATGIISKDSTGKEILLSKNLLVKCDSKYQSKPSYQTGQPKTFTASGN
jgi:cytochrome c-type biogenesis protein CcmE